MENRFLLLSRLKRNRQYSLYLIQFLETLSLFMQAGFDFSYSWQEGVRSVQKEWDACYLGYLNLQPNQTLTELLLNLAKHYPVKKHRVWFSCLHELYLSGASISPALRSISDVIRGEQECEREAHYLKTPGRLQILLIIFFFPPVFLLLFLPLLSSLSF